MALAGVRLSTATTTTATIVAKPCMIAHLGPWVWHRGVALWAIFARPLVGQLDVVQVADATNHGVFLTQGLARLENPAFHALWNRPMVIVHLCSLHCLFVFCVQVWAFIPSAVRGLAVSCFIVPVCDCTWTLTAHSFSHLCNHTPC